MNSDNPSRGAKTSPGEPARVAPAAGPSTAKPAFRSYLWAFGLGTVLVAGSAALHVRSEYRKVMDEWQARQSSVADYRTQMISEWLKERQADAQDVAGEITVLRVLSPGPERGRMLVPARLTRELNRSLDRFAHVHGYPGVYVLDPQGRVVGHSTKAPELEVASLEASRLTARTGEPRIDLLGAVPDRRRVSFTYSVSAEETETDSTRSRPPLLGAALILADPVQTLFPRLLAESVPTRTGEVTLVRHDGNEIDYVAPLRLASIGATGMRRPHNAAALAARTALAGQKVFGEFQDYRGVSVLAATRRIPQTGWGLVGKIDRAEAFEQFRQMVIVEGLAVGLLGILLAGVLITHRRYVLTRVLDREEKKFRALLEAAPDAMVVVNQGGEIVLLNRQAEKQFGYRRDELLGKNVKNIILEGFAERLIADALRSAEDALAQEIGSGVELMGRRKDGSDFPIEIMLSPLKSAEGILVTVGIRDISERQRAGERVRQINTGLEARVSARTVELEVANKELEAFTYSVSHDLRAPLRHIDGFSKLLLEEHSPHLPEAARRYLALIRDATRRMGLMVDDLLNLTRIGRKELSLRVTGLNSLVEEVKHNLEPDMRGREIEWRISTLPFVECDPALMKQVFANLFSNAMKFTRSRQQALIEVGSEANDGCHVIFVRDNGVGFSMKYADKLFGVFQRLHRQEDFEGTGIGLATVQRIIQKHGGRVWAESELNKGAAFYFTLKAPENHRPEHPPVEGGQP